MTCAFHSQNYIFLLIDDWGIPFGEKATKGHSEVYGRLWWKSKYPQTKTGEKISVKLVCDGYVYSSQRDKTSLILHSLDTPSWRDLQRNILEHIQAYGEKGNIFR